jgi:hypothetical protein
VLTKHDEVPLHLKKRTFGLALISLAFFHDKQILHILNLILYSCTAKANISLNFDDLKTLQSVREIGEWSRKMGFLLRKLVARLGDTLDAWDRFQRKDICYFLFDDDSPTDSTLLKQSVNNVDTLFLDLKDILKKLRRLEEDLCKQSPQGVSHFSC